MLALIAVLTQAATMPPPTGMSLAEIAQTLTSAGVLGLVGFAFKFNARMTRLETVLLEPELGVVPRMRGIGKQGHTNTSDLQGHRLMIDEHGRRLDGLDEDVARLERDKESRRVMGPADVGSLNRGG